MYVIAPEKLVLIPLFHGGGLDKPLLWMLALLASVAFDLVLGGLMALGAGLGAGNLTPALTAGYVVTTLGALHIWGVVLVPTVEALCRGAGTVQIGHSPSTIKVTQGRGEDISALRHVPARGVRRAVPAVHPRRFRRLGGCRRRRDGVNCPHGRRRGGSRTVRLRQLLRDTVVDTPRRRKVKKVSDVQCSNELNCGCGCDDQKSKRGLMYRSAC